MDINVKVRLESPELMAAILALAEALQKVQLGNVLQIKEGQTYHYKNSDEHRKAVGKAEYKNEESSKERAAKEKAAREEAAKRQVINKEAAKEKVEKEVKAIALEDVRTKLSALSRDGKTKEVKALIKKFGGNKLTEVNPENYEALLKEAEAIFSIV